MRIPVIISIVFICIACNQTEEPIRKDGFSEVPKTKEDSLYKEVMEGHDIGMAKIGRIRKAIEKTKKSLDSLNKLPRNKLDPNYQQALIDLQEDLNYANYAMDTWMDEFKVDSAKGNAELRIRYLEAEKDKVNKVKDAILNGLKRADSLLKN
jgi:hypothetical protein